MNLDKNLTKKDWQQLASLVQQLLETGQCHPSERQRKAGKKLVAAVENASQKRPKKRLKGRWWLKASKVD